MLFLLFHIELSHQILSCTFRILNSLYFFSIHILWALNNLLRLLVCTETKIIIRSWILRIHRNTTTETSKRILLVLLLLLLWTWLIVHLNLIASSKRIILDWLETNRVSFKSILLLLDCCGLWSWENVETLIMVVILLLRREVLLGRKVLFRRLLLLLWWLTFFYLNFFLLISKLLSICHGYSNTECHHPIIFLLMGFVSIIRNRTTIFLRIWKSNYGLLLNTLYRFWNYLEFWWIKKIKV